MKNFLAKAFHEAEPIVIHILCAVVLEAGLILLGLLIKALEQLFPKHEQHFSYLEVIDIGLAFLVLIMFGLYTVIIVFIRLSRGIIMEYKNKEIPVEPGQKEFVKGTQQ